MTGSTMRAHPGSSRLLVHPAAGSRGRSVRVLSGSSDWRRVAVDRLGAAAVAVTGTRFLDSADWTWPSADAEQIEAALREHLPGLRLVGAAMPRQAGRERLSLLGRAAGTFTVVKLGSGAHGTGGNGNERDDVTGSGPDAEGSLSIEAESLQLLSADPLPGIATPEVLAAGKLLGSIEFVATSLSTGPQRPAIDAPLRTFTSDLAVRLASLPRPDGTPADAVPIHGDLTPWNLRRTGRGLALFDWESAGWGSPEHDLETYRRSCDEVRPTWKPRRKMHA